MMALPRNRWAGGPKAVVAVATAVATILATIIAAWSTPAAATAAAAPPPGTLTTFAGGLGAGPATGIAQMPISIIARGGRLVSVEGGFRMPPGDTPRPGLVRAIDLASGNQTVLAGVLDGGYRGDGGPATSAQLDYPHDAAIDAAGNVYITDTGNDRIRKVTPGGTISTFAGNGVAGFSGDGGAASSASIQRPLGITVSPSGDVVFADQGNYRIRKVSPSGRITTIAGTGAREGPTGDGGPATAAAIDARSVEFDPAGNLYFGDFLHTSVRRISVDGTITTSGSTYLPVFDGAGNSYVNAGRGIDRTDPSGAVTTIAGTARAQLPGEPNGDGGLATDAFVYASGLAFDGGSIYVLETSNRVIRRIDPDGIITTVAGNGTGDYQGEGVYGGDGGQAAGAQFRYVDTIRSGPTGTYVADPHRGEIRRIDPSGIVSTIYEAPDPFRDIAVDDGGNVFISGWDHRVRRLTPSGVLSTVAGTGQAGAGGDGGPAALAQLSSPGPMAVGAGNLYIHEFGTRRIRRIDPLGIITTLVGGSSDPYQHISYAIDTFVGAVGDMALGPDGTLFWTEGGGDESPLEVHKVSCGIARQVTSASTGGGSDLAVDAAGHVYFIVGDHVVRDKLDGTRSVVAGSGGSLPFENVPATSVALRYPRGVAIHPSGALLFGNQLRVHQVEGVTAGRPVVTQGPCAAPDRPVWGSGYNALGQLGDGTTADRSSIEAANPPLTKVTAAAGGVGHSLALRSDGAVWAAGWNGYGQIGDGTTAQRLRPVQVAGLTGAVAVAGGAFHSLALKSDGTVWAWGMNVFGQLGDRTTAQRNRPVQVPGLSGVVAISAGSLHSLAVKADGSVWSWGYNAGGQLGDGTVVDRAQPTRVSGLTGAVGVAGGGQHSVAVLTDGTVRAWGWNFYGQLGDGSTVDRRSPVPVVGPVGVKAVAAGAYHSLALGTDGWVAAWGFGEIGQLGDRRSTSSSTPVVSINVSGAVAIAAGAYHSIALLGDGTTMAWGWNHFGQLGLGAAHGWDTPVPTNDLDHNAAIGVGAYHTLFVHRFPE